MLHLRLIKSEDGAICNNSLRLKAVYQSIVTRSSILNVSSGPRPACDYNGISLNSKIASSLCPLLFFYSANDKP